MEGVLFSLQFYLPPYDCVFEFSGTTDHGHPQVTFTGTAVIKND
jgi:hypothetical protein